MAPRQLRLLTISALPNPTPPTAASANASEMMKQELLKIGVEKFTSPKHKVGVIRHIVAFKYRTNITKEGVTIILK
jgi:hypothetical protein